MTILYVQNHLNELQQEQCMISVETIASCTCLSQQGSTLRRACMPGACRSCHRAHKPLWLHARVGKWLFLSGHVLIFPAVYINFAGLVQILAGHVKFFAGHITFQNYMPDRHVNQMLNVKPCTEYFNGLVQDCSISIANALTCRMWLFPDHSQQHNWSRRQSTRAATIIKNINTAWIEMTVICRQRLLQHFITWKYNTQGSFCVCAQLMRDDFTL